METGQVKSRQRVSDHGEVFTSSREVDVNVDLHFAAEKRRRRSNLLPRPRTRPSKRAGEYICYYTYSTYSTAFSQADNEVRSIKPRRGSVSLSSSSALSEVWLRRSWGLG